MSTEAAVPDSTASSRFEASLQAEAAAEQDLARSLVIAILVALPVSIVIFLFMMAIAISDKTQWYVWIGLGVGLGVICAVLFGSLAGATLNAHKLDEVDHDRDTYGT
jgi:Na+/H+ antiporter NhaC